MRNIIGVSIFILLLLTTAAEAVTRPPIFQNLKKVWLTGPQRTNAELICPWTTGSVPWDWPAAQQSLYLGICPPQGGPRWR